MNKSNAVHAVRVSKPPRRDSRSRVTVAGKQIARYIRERHLAVGDFLPPESELAATLGFCQNTLHLAMRQLVDLGLITRRRRHGTIIHDLEALNRLTWTVGLASFSNPIQGPGAFHAWLLHAMLGQLAGRHCACHTYFRTESHHWPHRIADYPGLAEDVAEGAIDGMILLTNLEARDQAVFERAGIPLLYCGARQELPRSILIDYPAMIANAAAALTGCGARRLALVCTNDMGIREFDALARSAARAPGGQAVATEIVIASPTLDSGEQAARAFSQRPAAKRPDALIMTDDYTAAGAARIFAAHREYAPQIAVLSNKQLPQAWPFPVMLFEMDIAEFAERAVRMLHATMLEPSLPPRLEWVGMRLATDENVAKSGM